MRLTLHSSYLMLRKPPPSLNNTNYYLPGSTGVWTVQGGPQPHRVGPPHSRVVLNPTVWVLHTLILWPQWIHSHRRLLFLLSWVNGKSQSYLSFFTTASPCLWEIWAFQAMVVWKQWSSWTWTSLYQLVPAPKSWSLYLPPVSRMPLR